MAQKLSKYILCGSIVFISVLAIHSFVTKKELLGNYAYILGLGFPLLFLIGRKEVRNITLTLCIVAIYLHQGWIGIICIGITALVFIGHWNKELAVLLIAIAIPFSLVANKIYPNISTPIHELKTRLEFHIFTLDKWQKVWTGHGHGSFAKLPENQPKNRADGKWSHVSHSDLIQGFYDYGIVAMSSIIFLALIPFTKANTNLPILSAYVCLLFQSAVDFPFHRLITGFLGVIIVLLMYERFLKKEICE